MMREERHGMARRTRESGGPGFAIGLVTGTVIGVGLAMWLAPRAAAEIRLRMADAARRFGDRASERYQQAGARVGEAVEDLARKGDEVRDTVAGAVERGARKVERYAAAAKSDRGL